MKLTESNVTEYGFILYGSNKNFGMYGRKEIGFVLSFCKITDEICQSGSFYYGSDFIKIDTVEELKMLYLLVTKKELIKI